jgi:anti-sigma factor RsiW
MMTSNYENHCGWALDHIEPYLDDELRGGERARFERHVRACDTCASELRFAARVVGELRSLPALRAPERAATVSAAPEAAPSPIERLLARLGESWMLARRPAMVAMIVVIAAVGTFVISQHEEAPTVAVSDEEIEEAAQQTLLAFAYIGKYSRRTGVMLRDEVIGGYVVDPVERAFAGAGNTETKNQHERSDK